MSATPISPEFTPKALEGIEEIRAEWKETDNLKVILERTNKPYLKAANIINTYKNTNLLTINTAISIPIYLII